MAVGDDAARLLRTLRSAKRISQDESDTLYPQLQIGSKNGTTSDMKIKPTEKSAKLLRDFLLDGRLSPAEFEILHAAQATGITIRWCAAAKIVVLGLGFKLIQLFRGPPAEPPAVSRVFSTPELLERILVYVPVKDLLLRAPLTCKRFHQATDTSPCLRRRLFLEPDLKCSRTAPLPSKLKARNFASTITDPIQQASPTTGAISH